MKRPPKSPKGRENPDNPESNTLPHTRGKKDTGSPELE
jgi:hypothetical protein